MQVSGHDDIPRAVTLGVPIALVTRARLTRYTIDALEDANTTIVFAIHVVGLNLLKEDVEYERAMLQADLVHADGTSVMLAARAAGHRIPERIATQDFMYDLVRHCAEHGHSVFLLGGSAGIAARAGDELIRRFPTLRVAGARDGFFGPDQEADVASEIRSSGAHLLLVGMGCPREQIWSAKHAHATGVRLLVTVGGTFDYIVGDESRAPHWVQQSKLEWAWRLAQNPRRLAPRYIGGIPLVAKKMLQARRDSRHS